MMRIIAFGYATADYKQSAYFTQDEVRADAF